MYHNFVNYVAEYIDVVGASCLGNSTVKYFHKFIVKCIDIVGGFMPGNRRVKYLCKLYCEIH
jgi:hypothetical protein